VHYLDTAGDGQRFSSVAGAPVKVDLGLFAGRDGGGGVVVLGLARLVSSLVDSDGTVAMSTLINDSVEVVEIRRISTEGIEVIDFTIIRGTIDVKESKETTVAFSVSLGVEDEGTSIFTFTSEETTSFRRFDDTIGDLFEVNIDTGEGKGRESE